MNKHAYLITSNGNLKVLEAGIRMLDDVRNDFFILFDKKAHIPVSYRERLRSIVGASNLRILNDLEINWGGVSQIGAELQLLKAAVPHHYEYYHYLQGADLPIRGNDSIWEFFENHNGTEFVSVEFRRQKMAESKCHYYHFFCHNKYFRKNKFVKLLNFGLVALQKALHIRHNTDIPLYQGSALFSITDAFARYILDHESEIWRRFRRSLAADEVFIPTLLMNSPFKERTLLIAEENRTSNARHIDRTRPDGKNSPHIWRKDELGNLLDAASENCFARKFVETVDMAVVDELEQQMNK